MTSSLSVGWNLKPGARAVGVVVFIGVFELWVLWSSLERYGEEEYVILGKAGYEPTCQFRYDD